MACPCRSLVSMLLLLLGGLLWTLPGYAAGDTDREQSAALKRDGDAAMDDLRYAEAISAYTRAYAAYPDPALLYNRGRAHQARGEYAEALDDFLAFQREASPELLERVPALEELITDVSARIASVQVECSVAGARVAVNGRAVGQCPLDALRHSEGEDEIEITAPGYHPFRQRLTLLGGDTTHVEATLGPVKKTGVLRVKGPQGAEVLVDGRPIGHAPAEIALPPGRHRVTMRRPGYRESQGSVMIESGQERTLELEPRLRKPITTRWWFWTSIGVAVVAGASTVALLTEKPPDDGDNFNPGRVAGPLVVQF